MKHLERNKRIIYYALYEGENEIMKDGFYTGAREKVYSDVVEAKMGVGAPRTAYGYVSSVVKMEYFGLDKPYSKVMWTDDLDCPITEETIVWADLGKVNEFAVTSSYIAGDKVIHGGRIYRCEKSVLEPGEFDPDSWSLVRHNYIVDGIAKSLNFISYNLKEVDFT